MHANIGPSDSPITRAILRADAELKQVSPNLTFIYDPDITLMTCCWKWRKTSVNVANRTSPTVRCMIKFSQKGLRDCELLQLTAAGGWWQHAGTP